MAQTLAQALSNNPVPSKHHIVEVVRNGEQITLPVGMTIEDAMQTLKRRAEYEKQSVTVVRTFPCAPLDGAYAFSRLLMKKYGWVPNVEGWFIQPPTLINVPTGVKTSEQVLWGTFSIPVADGTLKCHAAEVDGQWRFQIVAQIKRYDELTIVNLLNELGAYIQEESIYRGKAVKIRFRDDAGKLLPEARIQFMDTEVDKNMLIYPATVQAQIDTNLFTPISRAHDLIAAGIPIKRGVLIGGTYGVGKTMAAKVAALLAVENQITYVYIEKASELPDAIRFAQMYQSPAAVVFCEDIDRVLDGERDEAMDQILNTLDGIDGKNAKVMVILTTNNLLGINQAMLRPGRLDAVIEVTTPDAEAVQRLLRAYGGELILPTEDLTEASQVLEGNIPAVISEVVVRAKLAQLRMTPRGVPLKFLTSEALTEAAVSMAGQLKLLNRDPTEGDEAPTIDDLIAKAAHRGYIAAENGDEV